MPLQPNIFVNSYDLKSLSFKFDNDIFITFEMPGSSYKRPVGKIHISLLFRPSVIRGPCLTAVRGVLPLIYMCIWCSSWVKKILYIFLIYHRGFNANSDVYTILYPYFLHPFTHIAMAGTIFMTLAITIERYLGLCHPLLNPQSRKAWFYVVPVVIFSVLLNVPKFLVINKYFFLDLNSY